MEFQFHPASRSASVRSLRLGDWGEKAALVLAAIASLLALSLWITVPAVVRRSLRHERAAILARETEGARREWRDAAARAADLRRRAGEAGDLLSRIAFLYRLAPGRWPRSLNPQTGILARTGPEELIPALSRYLAALDRGLALCAEAEAADPALARRTPSRLPLAEDLVEPSVFFGPRVSPWTGAGEFFTGLDLAAPAGTPVSAPADGTVVFAGRVAPSATSRLSRLGMLVVVSHAPGGATLFGHLARVDVRRGERVVRGQRLGSVGSSGRAVSPGLHYEVWLRDGAELAPTDPQFAILDRQLGRRDLSLETMLATSVPGPIEPLPGM